MLDDNPILIRAHRGGHLESMHRGTWALCRSDGTVLAAAGDPSQLVFARSSSKSFQALPLVETGAADAFGLGSEGLALALASHDGEPQHTEGVARVLDQVGLTSDQLRCGEAAPQRAVDGWQTSRIVHNCSGKHAGFLALAKHLGDDPADYLCPQTRTQQLARDAVAEMTGHDALGDAIDGCGAPTFRAPLAAWATGIARMANPESLPAARADACRRLVAAAAAHPDLVGGTERLDSSLLRVTGGRVFPKIGAEAVYVAGIVGEDLGLAIKIDDGRPEIARTLAVSILTMIDAISPDEAAKLTPWGDLVIRNSNNDEIGRYELTEAAIGPAL